MADRPLAPATAARPEGESVHVPEPRRPPAIATVNPTTGEILETVRAVRRRGGRGPAGRRGRGAAHWASTAFEERSRLLVTVAELLEGELPDIAHVVTTEMGKPFAQAKGEVAKCASALRWFAEQGEGLLSDEEVLVDASLAPGHLPAARAPCWPSCPGTSRCGRWSGSPPRP